MDITECPAIQYDDSYIYFIWAILATVFSVGAVIKILYSKKWPKSNGYGYTKLKQFPEEESQKYRRLYEEERMEKEKALERLSKIMSTRLTDGNPNIANLSDEKRPTKLAEEYSELYDNAWSDAFESISKGHESKMKIDFLRQILQVCFKWCSERSAYQLKQLDNLLHCPGVPLDDVKMVNQRPINRDFLKNFKDERKQLGKETAECITKEILTKISNEFINTAWHAELHQASVKTYSEQCAKLCWLMVVQDPSMDIGFSITDIHQYKAYTRSGHQIDYVVWPPLYLHKGGNLMSKGIAQMK